MVVQSKNFLNSKGQSTVEYILLLLVVSVLGFSVVKSDAFKKFFGKDSVFFKTIAMQIQYSYRHGRLGTSDEINSDTFTYQKKHDTYKFNDEDKSRFFTIPEKYPDEN